MCMKRIININLTKMIIFLALFLLMGYIENIIPLNIGYFGIKLGLSNLVFLVSLYILGPKKSVILSFLRVVIINLLFGDILHFAISMAGFVFSSIIMIFLFYLFNISVVLISIYGAVFHVLGQYIVVFLILKNISIIKLLPLSLVFSIICGFIIGLLAKIILLNSYINKMMISGINF